MANVTISSTQTQQNKQCGSQRLKAFYFICIVVSVVVSWGIFSTFLTSGDAGIASFFAQAFASPVASLVSSDVLLSAVIFLAAARVELKRLNMPAYYFYLYLLATLSVGVCCSLSLFLYQREAHLCRM